jgi:hypothetical protein
MQQYLIDHVLDRLEADERTSYAERFDHGGPLSVQVGLIQDVFLRLATLRSGKEAPAGLASRTCQRLSVHVAEERSNLPTSNQPPIP